MNIFKYFSKKGYIIGLYHGTEGIDKLPLKHPIRIAETALLCEWLRINHGIWVEVLHKGDMSDFTFKVCELDKNNCKKVPNYIHDDGFNSPQEAYLVAFDYIKNNNLI